MKVTDFSFELPDELIAQHPSDRRSDDRLLVIDRKTGALQDKMFKDFPSLLERGSVLVLNNTKVRKARVFATNENGGKVECLFLNPNADGSWDVITNRSKRRKIGERLYFEGTSGVLTSFKDEGVKTLKFDSPLTEDFFEKVGHVPLPPYIKREDEFSDESRYQTVYSKILGSAASPTSGLHFTNEILSEIQGNGVEIAYVTLHVGMGTFSPLHTETLEEHKMHTEHFEITREAADTINRVKSRGGRIIASGTTVMRTLESAWDVDRDRLISKTGETNIFIYPGFKFHAVDRLLTNFHTPESTLFALVCAFSSMDIAKSAYKHAVDEKYRFFSYGDATFWM